MADRWSWRKNNSSGSQLRRRCFVGKVIKSWECLPGLSALHPCGGGGEIPFLRVSCLLTPAQVCPGGSFWCQVSLTRRVCVGLRGSHPTFLLLFIPQLALGSEKFGVGTGICLISALTPPAAPEVPFSLQLLQMFILRGKLWRKTNPRGSPVALGRTSQRAFGAGRGRGISGNTWEC